MPEPTRTSTSEYEADNEGDDRYGSLDGENGSIWFNGTWGVGIDK